MEIGFGLYRFREEASGLLTAYLREGGRILDAAPNYWAGEAHALIANHKEACLQCSDLKIWSKVGFPRCHGILKQRIEAGIITASELVHSHALNPRLIHEQIADTRRELHGLVLDAVYLHNPERQLLRLSKKAFWQLMEECIRALEEACAAGFIRRWGISVWEGLSARMANTSPFTIQEWEAATRNVVGSPEHHFELVQMPISLARIDAVVDYVQKGSGVIQDVCTLGKCLVASSPMSGGALPPALSKEFTELFGTGVSPGQACLLFLASIPGVTNCLISPRSEEQLNDSLAALSMTTLSRQSLCNLLACLVG